MVFLATETQAQLQDQDVLQSVLNQAKLMASSINQFILEASTEELRRDYMNVLGEVYAQQKQVYDIMQQKGYYNPGEAEQQNVAKVQKKFAQGQQDTEGTNETNQQMQ